MGAGAPPLTSRDSSHKTFQRIQFGVVADHELDRVHLAAEVHDQVAGLPVLTWGYTYFGSPREGHFRPVVAPRLLVSPDLVIQGLSTLA
jgi:hypothetical protein